MKKRFVPVAIGVFFIFCNSSALGAKNKCPGLVKKDDFWFTDRIDSHYKAVFPGINEPAEFLNARRKEGLTTHVLDLAGSATFLGPDSSLADTLTGLRLLQTPKHPRLPTRDEFSEELKNP